MIGPTYRLWMSDSLLIRPSSVTFEGSLVANAALRDMFNRNERELLALKYGDVGLDQDCSGKNPFSGRAPGWTGISRHIGYHCLAVAAVAKTIGKLVIERRVDETLTEESLPSIISTALLHDSLKRLEILCLQSGRKELHERVTRLAVIENHLKKKGCPEDLLARMRSATDALSDDTILSLTSVDHGLVSLAKGRWKEKILLLSDAMTSTNLSLQDPCGETHVLTPYDRIIHSQLLKRAKDISVAFYVLNGRVVTYETAQKEGGEPLANAETFLAWFAGAIAAEIVSSVYPGSDEHAPTCILRHVRESLEIFS